MDFSQESIHMIVRPLPNLHLLVVLSVNELRSTGILFLQIQCDIRVQHLQRVHRSSLNFLDFRIYYRLKCLFKGNTTAFHKKCHGPTAT